MAYGNGVAELFAADFHNGQVAVFDSKYKPVKTSGGFVDSNLPKGFAPFNTFAYKGLIFVTYALQDEDAHDDVKGPGNGFVDAFDTDGNLVTRLISRGSLNSPWAMQPTPFTFGNASLDTFDDFVKDWNAAGGKQITKEVRDWYATAGGK